MNLEESIADFTEYLSSCGLSERTIEAYSNYARRFVGFLVNYYPRIRSFEKVTKDIILDFQNFLATSKTRNEKRLANKSQGLVLRAVRKLFSFLVKRDLILKDPTTVITMPKEEQTIARNVLTSGETFDLLESIRMDSPVGVRNRAIAELFYACGIRTSELCSLKVQDVDFKDQTVTIRKGKGGKSRILPIGQYASFYIEKYLEKARKYMLRGKREDSGHLFLSQRGNPFNRSTINRTVMRSIERNTGLTKHISCYTFRHSVATQLLKNKVDITYIARLLGHASLKTTQRYLKIDITDLKKMHSLHHPREGLSEALCGEVSFLVNSLPNRRFHSQIDSTAE